MKTRVFIALCLFYLSLMGAGCSRSSTGLRSIEEARKAADDFILHAEAESLLQHMESGTITENEKKVFYQSAKRWEQAQLRKHPVSNESLTLVEFEDSRKKFQKDWPVEMPYAPLQWSHEPEIVFVYHFEIESEKEPFSGMFSVGAYSKNGLWYFAKQK